MTIDTNEAVLTPPGQARMGVLRSDGQYRLIACAPVPAGARLFAIDGEPTDVPSRYSIQIDTHRHLDLPRDCPEDVIIDTYFWRYMNHSCEPNVRIHQQEVFASTDIRAGEEITFHYNTTEAHLAEPFACRCATAWCTGRIAGFAAAHPAERERLWPWAAPHLRALHQDPDGHAAPSVDGLPQS
ncbi:SET domain-containing protein-lysine N-methyltransferase [Streptomyces sp. NPDC059917]|uniref:SET domain-containing protein-lysine N-methyltransferase n=1 Tax=Streptomyces sp. NPDC059917 TaxID=3347002 RepID=UPI003653741E